MSSQRKPSSSTRAYNAPIREASARQTRARILEAAKREFEEHGWTGTTIRTIATSAGVSPKSVEATFGTKSRLLESAVTFAIRGDAEPVEMLHRSHIAEMEEVASAGQMLDLHAAHLRRVNSRSARIAFAVEQAAGANREVEQLWARMNHNRWVGVRWATSTLLAKPRTGHLEPAAVQTSFLVAFEWGTYRVLTTVGRLSDARFEAWLRSYYRSVFRIED